MTTTPATMNALWNAAGRTAVINGEARTIVSVRACYGRLLRLRLDRPLSNYSYTSFTATPANVGSILLAD